LDIQAVDNLIEDLERYDPMDEAENLARAVEKNGEHIRQDEVIGLTLAFQMENVKRKIQLAMMLDDTAFSDTFTKVQRILEEEGFTEQLRVPFKAEYDREEIEEEYVIYASKEGLVATTESYGGAKRLDSTANTIQLYFSIIGTDYEKRWNLRASMNAAQPVDVETGRPLHFIKREDFEAWVRDRKPILMTGHVDARGFLRSKLRQLRATGQIQPVWKETPFLWFLHYMDKHAAKSMDYEYEVVSRDRIRASGPLLQSICAIALDEYGDVRGGLFDGLDLSRCSDEALETLKEPRDRKVSVGFLDRFKGVALPGAYLDGRPVSTVDGRPILSRTQRKRFKREEEFASPSYRKWYNTKGKRERRRQIRREIENR
jgi:hypothetical protein